MSRRPIACADCPRTFRSAFALSQHRFDTHGEPHPHHCAACDQRFASADRLATHNRIHHPDPPLCMECGGVSRLTTGEEIYPAREDLHHKPFYRCDCGAYCGCHPGTREPLGYPAGIGTRRARTAAHAVFDALWRSGEMSRQDAYTWLRTVTGIAPEFCHIGMMTAGQARQVVALVEARSRAEAA